MVCHLFKIFLLFILLGSPLSILTQAEPLEGNDVTRVENGKYPYVVSIAYKNLKLLEEKNHICTGVLITKKYVLSAAHCFNGKSVHEIQIIVGSVDLRKGKNYDISSSITYNQWVERKNIISKKGSHDIAIAKLLGKIVSSQVAVPVPLSFEKTSDLYHQHLVIVGWGQRNESSKERTRYLHEATVKVLPNTDCENLMFNISKRVSIPTDRYLCTKGDPNVFIAHGDSGGPILKMNTVVGINRGVCPKSGSCDLPQQVVDNHKINIHTNVDFYREFIADVIKDYRTL